MKAHSRRQAIRRATPVRSARTGGRARAFTLVELIAVMVITAVLAALAAPALSRASTLRATVAANTLMQDVLYARERAQVSGVTTWVDFSLPDGWALLTEDPLNPGRASVTSLNDPATGAPLARSLNDEHFVGVSISSLSIRSGASLGFDPLGRPLDISGGPLSAPAVVVFSSNHRLAVAPVTGFPTLVIP